MTDAQVSSKAKVAEALSRLDEVRGEKWRSRPCMLYVAGTKSAPAKTPPHLRSFRAILLLSRKHPHMHLVFGDFPSV